MTSRHFIILHSDFFFPTIKTIECQNQISNWQIWNLLSYRLVSPNCVIIYLLATFSTVKNIVYGVRVAGWQNTVANKKLSYCQYCLWYQEQSWFVMWMWFTLRFCEFLSCEYSNSGILLCIVMSWQWNKMQFYKERILNAAQLKRLSEHKYSCTSASILDAWLQPWWCWLVSKTPLWLAPNLITILGLIVNVVTTLILVW